MKKIILVLFLINCTALQNFMGGGKSPNFKLKSVDISKINLENISLKLFTDIENPYPVSLPKSLIDMDVMIEGTRLSNIKNDFGKIDANSTKAQAIDLELKYQDLVNIYKNVKNKDLLDLNLKGNFALPIPESFQLAGKKQLDFPIDQLKQVPAVLPSIDIKNFKIIRPEPKINSSGLQSSAMNYLDNLLSGKKTSIGSAASAGLSNVDVDVVTEFDISLINQAASKLLFSDMKYDLKLNGENFLSGVPKEIIQNGAESIIKVKSSFPLKSLSSGLATAIQNKSSAFQLTGLSGVKVQGLPEGLLNFEYDKKGSLKW